MKTIYFSRLLHFALFCCMSLTSQGKINIEGQTPVGTKSGYNLFYLTPSESTITLSTSTGGFSYIYIDDVLFIAKSNLYYTWSDYSIDVWRYLVDDEIHKITLKVFDVGKNTSYVVDYCYITSNDSLVSDYFVDGIFYVVENNTAKVTKSLSTIENAVISETFSTYPVVEISKAVFKDRYKLKSVTIPGTIKSIGESAFSGCTNLTTLVFNAENCSSCGSSYYPAFPSTISSLTIGDKVKKIPDNFLRNGSKIKSLTIPNSVTSIGNYAFSACENLTTLEFNAENCLSCGTSSFPSTIINLSFGDKVMNIPYNFLYANNIESLTIPNTVTSIDYNAFRYSYSLKSLTFGLALQTIGSGAFGSTKIPKVFWLSNTPPSGYNNIDAYMNYVANDQYSMDNQSKYQFLSSMFSNDGIVYIPVSPSDRTCDVVDCIYSGDYSDVTIPNKVTNKGVDMSVVNINQYAFYNNSYIKSLSISNNSEIRPYSFSECSALAGLTISNTVKSVGDYAFSGCSSLSNVYVENAQEIEEEPTSQSFPDWTSTNHSDSSTSYEEYSLDVAHGDILTFNYSVDSEAGYDFFTVKIDGVQVVNESGTKNGSFRKEFDTKKTVTLYMSYTKDSSGSSGNDVASVTDIWLTSSGNTNSLVLGSNGNSPLFTDCPLDTVFIGRKLLYNTDSSFGYSPFYNNISLRAVEIADAESRIYDKEFYGCTNLKSIKIGNGVASIGERAFYGCTSLDYFSAGYLVESIGKEAFADCINLTKYYSCSVVPPVCGEQALNDINKWICTLYVPEGFTNTYQQADQWKDFFFINDDIAVPEFVVSEKKEEANVAYQLTMQVYEEYMKYYNGDGMTYYKQVAGKQDENANEAEAIFSNIGVLEKKVAGSGLPEENIASLLASLKTVKDNVSALNGENGEVFAGNSFYEKVNENFADITAYHDRLAQYKERIESLATASELNELIAEIEQDKENTEASCLTPVVNEYQGLEGIEAKLDEISEKLNACKEQIQSLSDETDAIITGIVNVSNAETECTTVYTLNGQQYTVRNTELKSLPKGIYIINGKKVLIK